MTTVIAALRWKKLLAAAGLLAAAACSDPLSPEGQRYPSQIVASGLGPIVEWPEVVDAGERFTFEFTVYLGGCESFDGAETSRVGRRIDVFPYTRMGETDGACPGFLKPVQQTVEIGFDSPGPATIALHGVDGGPDGEQVSLTFDVLVR